MTALVARDAPEEPGVPRWRASLLALLLSNLVPVAGVLLLDWRVREILLVWWTESAVIGFFNVLKMAVCGNPPKEGRRASCGAERFFMIPFFILHFGFFMAGHGVFVLLLSTPAPFGGEISAHEILSESIRPVLFGTGALFASHAFSFATNFLGRGEWRRARVEQLFVEPYSRIVLMHVAILAGALPVIWLGGPAPLLLVLTVLKTGFDARAHLRERRRAAAAGGPPPLPTGPTDSSGSSRSS